MEQEMFKPDPDKLRYSMEIEVYENCAILLFKGKDHELLKRVNYHEAIGVLETQKQHMIWQQRESNLAKKLKPKSQTAKKNGA